MTSRLAKLKVALLGEKPRALLPLTAPTLVAVATDIALRGHDFWVFEPHGKAIYVSSLLVSAAFWVLPLYGAARLVNASRGPKPGPARFLLALFFGLWVWPLATASYGGQILYFDVFHSYMGRDSLRLGALLRGSYRAWFLAWSSARGFWVALAAGGLATTGLLAIVRRQAPLLSGRVPLLPVLTFPAALFCFWTDNVDSRFLQAATPDACFVNGAVHAFRAAATGKGRVRQGVTLRAPASLPPLVSERSAPPNVMLILTESVRADTLCSDPPPRCRSRFLDANDVANDRIPLGKLTSQTPNTFSASLVLWTGLAPNADFADAHRAPVLWEIAHAAGYQTAYVTSQNAKYEDFGVFVHDAGIDWLRTSYELGDLAHEQLGVPDERAVDAMLKHVHGVPADAPYFAVLHLSNTHHPYRVDGDLQPFEPHGDDLSHGVAPYLNHYRNSVLMQERLVAGFVREIRSLPSWPNTVVVFVSDHGEQFGEHGLVHHNHSVWDVELRVPGWLVAGAEALDEGQRAALRTYAGVRTFSQDINATLVDLFGVERARSTLPFHDEVPGRSLLRPHDPRLDPTVLLSTSTGVWEPDDPWFGVMHGERVLIGALTSPWRCFDMARDPAEHEALPPSGCSNLLATAKTSFGPEIGQDPESH